MTRLSRRPCRSHAASSPAFLLCFCAIATGGCDAPTPLLLYGSTLLDGTARSPVPNARIVIETGRIVCVGAHGACPTPAGADSLDATGRWVIPGLFDTHVHLPTQEAPEQAERAQRLRFLVGITSTRDASTWGQFEATLDAAASDARADRPVPRTFVAGRLPRVEGESDTDLARRVGDLIETGAHSVKLKAPFSRAELRTVVEAASARDVDVYGHAWTGPPPRSLVDETLEAGVSGLSHLQPFAPAAVPESALSAGPDPEAGVGEWRLWRKALWLATDSDRLAGIRRRMIDARVWLEPLLVSEEAFAERITPPEPLRWVVEASYLPPSDPPASRLPERAGARDSLDRAIRSMHRFVLAFHQGGGQLLAGSDNVGVPGLALHQELQALVRAGLTPSEVIRLATGQAAAALGVGDSLGTVERGKLADLIVLSDDPVVDISAAMRPWRVIKGGRVYDPEALRTAIEAR